jgi:hypothetical protein
MVVSKSDTLDTISPRIAMCGEWHFVSNPMPGSTSGGIPVHSSSTSRFGSSIRSSGYGSGFSGLPS